MRLSIAMATYNGARYLQEQLGSFLIQTRLPDELVVCDDGSSDDTMQILHDFQNAAPFSVIVERNAMNLGFTKNFEKAVSLCTGDIVLLSDQDDIWFPDKIEQVEKSFNDNPKIALIVHDGEIVDENLLSRQVTNLQQVRNGFGTDTALVMGGMTAIRRLLLKYVLPIPGGIIGHDVWFHKIALLTNSRLVLDQPLQLIRRHGDNTSNWIASSNKRINKFDVFMSHLTTQSAQNYEDRILLNLELTKLLETMKYDCPFSLDDVQSGIGYLVSEFESISRRQNLLKENFIIRRISALKLLISGGYQHFNGIYSFIRDILR